MDWRRDPFPKVLLFVGGEGTFHASPRTFAIRAPMAVVVPAGRRHRIEDAVGRPLSLYGLCLKDPEYPGRALVRAVCGTFRMVINPDICRRMNDLLREVLAEERSTRPGADDLQLALVCRVLVMLARHPGPPGGERADSLERVAVYRRELETGFWRPENLDSVARSLGLSRRRFTQCFREVAGESWLACQTRLRMAHAGKLLRTTALAVPSVAFECGYGDIAHFYRVFRKAYGTSPGAFRKREREAGTAD